jgi:hypothetical protein
MGQRENTNDAAAKDAGTKLLEEEFALSMEQHGQRIDAAAKDAQVLLSKEECA